MGPLVRTGPASMATRHTPPITLSPTRSERAACGGRLAKHTAAGSGSLVRSMPSQFGVIGRHRFADGTVRESCTVTIRYRDPVNVTRFLRCLASDGRIRVPHVDHDPENEFRDHELLPAQRWATGDDGLARPMSKRHAKRLANRAKHRGPIRESSRDQFRAYRLSGPREALESLIANGIRDGWLESHELRLLTVPGFKHELGRKAVLTARPHAKRQRGSPADYQCSACRYQWRGTAVGQLDTVDDLTCPSCGHFDGLASS